jgi:hypothetical protein
MSALYAAGVERKLVVVFLLSLVLANSGLRRMMNKKGRITHVRQCI